MVLLFFVVLSSLAKPCFAYKEDTLKLTTQMGSGILSGSFEVWRHFKRLDEYDNFFLKEQLAQESKAEQQTKSVYPASWSLGVGYDRINSSQRSISDEFITAKGGLDVDLLSKLNGRLELTLGSIPQEEYRYGKVELSFEYLLSLKRKVIQEDSEEWDDEDQESESLNAFDYYRRERDLKFEKLNQEVKRVLASKGIEEENGDERASKSEHHVDYPHLRVAYKMIFNTHLIQPRTYSRIPELEAISNDVNMYQYTNGPEIYYAPNEKWTFGLQAHFNAYFNWTPDEFLSKMEIGSDIRSSYSASIGQNVFGFPSFVMREVMEWYPNERHSLVLKFSQISYSSSLFNSSFGINPQYVRSLGTRWRLGAEAGMTMFNNGTSALMSAFHLTLKL